jgi:hypothetical protein
MPNPCHEPSTRTPDRVEVSAIKPAIAPRTKHCQRSHKRRRIVSSTPDHASREKVAQETASCAKSSCSTAALNNALSMLDPDSKRLFKVSEMVTVIHFKYEG